MQDLNAKFEDALYVDCLRALDQLVAEMRNTNAIDDVYALSLYLDDQDDPRCRYGEFSVNTEARYRETSPDTAPDGQGHVASSPAEARWNYAFWLQTPAVRVPDAENQDLVELQQSVARASGDWYDDEEEERGDDAVWEKMDRIDDLFWGFFARCVRRAHNEGEIARRFGRPIPVIVHCLEFGEQQARHTAVANPPDLLTEFQQPW